MSFRLDVDSSRICGFEHIVPICECAVTSKKLNPTGKSKFFKFEDGKNSNIISEDSFVRTYSIVKDKTFAILTAYRQECNEKENIMRNRKLRAFLNQYNMGVHRLIGHWQEKQHDCSKIDAVEESYLIEKPTYDVSDEDFYYIVYGCLTIDGKTQDGAIIHFEDEKDAYYFMDAADSGHLTKIGTKLTLNKISNAYSVHVKKKNIPFVFEGEQIPSTILGAKLMRDNNIFWS